MKDTTTNSLSSIREKLLSVIQAETGGAPVTIDDSTSIRNLPGIESLHVLRIISRIEHMFTIELDDDVIFDIGTFGDLVRAVEQAGTSSCQTSQSPADACAPSIPRARY